MEEVIFLLVWLVLLFLSIKIIFTYKNELKMQVAKLGGGVKGVLKFLLIMILFFIALIIIGLITVWLSFQLLDFFKVIF